MKKIIRGAVLVACSLSAMLAKAADTSCRYDLEKMLIAPNAATSGNREMHAQPEENNGGVYKIRLYSVGADSDSKQVTTGLVELNTHTFKAFDITAGQNNKKPLDIDESALKAFLKKCQK